MVVAGDAFANVWNANPSRLVAHRPGFASHGSGRSSRRPWHDSRQALLRRRRRAFGAHPCGEVPQAAGRGTGAASDGAVPPDRRFHKRPPHRACATRSERISHGLVPTNALRQCRVRLKRHRPHPLVFACARAWRTRRLAALCAPHHVSLCRLRTHMGRAGRFQRRTPPRRLGRLRADSRPRFDNGHPAGLVTPLVVARRQGGGRCSGSPSSTIVPREVPNDAS